VSSGPEYGGAESIFRSPLGDILPGSPTASVYDRGYVPQITDIGDKHPVTEGLEALFPPADGGERPGLGPLAEVGRRGRPAHRHDGHVSF